MKKKYLTVPLIFVLVITLSNNNISVIVGSIDRDYWPTEGWQDATFEEADMDEGKINEMFEYLENSNYVLDSILIVKYGFMVVEEYPRYYGPNTLHYVYSVTKSFVSTLIGLAIEEGYVEGVHQPILDFFENVTVANLESKENVTIEHLLTMTSGINWEEDISYYDPANSFRQMKESPNWVEFVLNQTMVYEPGTAFKYNSGGSHLLSAIVEIATGKSSLEYATEHIFDPLGFGSVGWDQDPQGIYFGGADIQLFPRDMAKFGYLFLNNGTWNGTQIVPELWVHNASQAHVTLNYWTSYGYQWWVYPQIETFLALGWAGQLIFVVPEHDLVTVFTSSLPESEWPFTTLIQYIIDSSELGYTESSSIALFATILPIFMIGYISGRNKKDDT